MGAAPGLHWSELLRQAKEIGDVSIHACSLSMDLLDITEEDLDPWWTTFAAWPRSSGPPRVRSRTSEEVSTMTEVAEVTRSIDAAGCPAPGP